MPRPVILSGTPPASRFPLARPVQNGGFTLTEVLVATAVAAILGSTAIMGLLATQKYAASTRVLNQARFIVQRNIATALGVKFTSVEVPPILELTSTSGAAFNGEGITTSGSSIPIITKADGTPVISGTLTRIVTAYPNDAYAVIRRVTFRINYKFQDREVSYSMSTIRSQDDQ